MVKLLLIRHGQTEWNITGRYQGQSDVELSEDGKEQARQLAKNFAYGNVDAVYSSPLKRAMFTAKAVADKFGLEVIPEESFKEINFGDWEGCHYTEIQDRWPEEFNLLFNGADVLQIPGGESFPELQKRAMKKIHELVEKHEGKTIAIVAHGAIIRAILTAVLGMPVKNVWKIRQDNTAVNLVRYDGDMVNVELMNSTFHLEKAPIGGNLQALSQKK